MTDTPAARQGAAPAAATGAEPPWPEPIDERAFYGVAGEIVREFAPQTEADRVGILAVLLAGCGNALDRGIYFDISGKRHELRLYPCLVGPTSRGRKGTAQSVAEAVLSHAVPGWLKRRRRSGLSTGEGLIFQVRDAITTEEPIRDKGKIITGYQELITDKGEDDKRIFVVEEEFGRAIKVLSRDNNTLSAVIRDAWDGNPLHTLAKTSYGTGGAHVTIIGHITPEELQQQLTSTDMANGFANRFLWICVRRSRLLPRPKPLDAGKLSYYGGLLDGLLADARERLGLLTFDAAAEDLWDTRYAQLEDRPRGLVGDMTARASQQVIRLAATYAALDVSTAITRAHLEAALALWRYAEDSVYCLFGDTTGDPVQDRIIVALRERPRTTTELQNVFSRNLPQLGDTLELIEDRGLVRQEEAATGKPGPRPTVWHLVVPEPTGGQR